MFVFGLWKERFHNNNGVNKIFFVQFSPDLTSTGRVYELNSNIERLHHPVPAHSHMDQNLSGSSLSPERRLHWGPLQSLDRQQQAVNSPASAEPINAVVRPAAALLFQHLCLSKSCVTAPPAQSNGHLAFLCRR